MELARRALAGHVCRACALIAAGILTLQAPGALAQEEKKSPGAYSIELEEVVVTAQKREESALSVPIAVGVFGARDILNTGALTIQDIQDFIPGFEVGRGGVTQAAITIRGVSSSSISTGGDPSVSTLYDDSYVPRAATTMGFTDIARIEVLKGPQGTLFGRNASAGVVSIVPNRPGPELEGGVGGRFGNYNSTRVEGMVNVPVTDTLFLRANLMSNRRDGFIDNIGTGGDPGAEDNMAARLSALWQVGDATDVQLSYDWDKVDQPPRMAIGLSPEFSEGGGDPWAGKVANDVDHAEETRDMYVVSLKLNHAFNDRWSLFGVTSYREFDTTNLEDEDGTGRRDRYFDTNNIEDSDIWYNELRVHFDTDKVSWITGVNYSEESVAQITSLTGTTESVTVATSNLILDSVAPELFGTLENLWDPQVFSDFVYAFTGGIRIPASDIAAGGDLWYDFADAVAGPEIRPLSILPPSLAGLYWTEEMRNTGDFESRGVFTDLTYAFTEKMKLALGARYSEDKKEYTWFYAPTTINAVRPGTPNFFLSQQATSTPLDAGDEWSKTTGRAVLSWDFSDAAMSYLSYSTGYKSGGFDALQLNSSLEGFEPEEMTNLELGVKGDLFDDRVRVELALFHQELENRQQAVDSRPPGNPTAVPTIINGDQEFEGWELVVQWAVSDSLRLGVSTTGREDTSRFERYYDLNANLTSGDESVAKIEPQDKYTLRFDWTPAIPVGSLLLHVDYVFDANNVQDDPFTVEDDAFLNLEGWDEDRKYLSARLAWTSPSEKLELALWGTNLLDEKYTGGPGGYVKDIMRSPLVGLEEPLMWGGEVRYLF